VEPNRQIANFATSKKHLWKIYATARAPQTLYAGCEFVGKKIDWARCCIDPPKGPRRRLEWEHVVPAAAFGRQFDAWTDGHARCVDRRGKRFRGRKCARRVSASFRKMEADMHNLYPSVGLLNEARSHFPMALLAGEPRRFGRCDFEVSNKKVEPRPQARGEIARAYLYMAAAYPRFALLSDAQRAELHRWNRQDPPTHWERERNRAVRAVQGNENPFIQ